MSKIVRTAVNRDVDDIVKLLKKGKLNSEGIEEHFEHFIVVEDVEEQQIVGTAGMEVIDTQYGLFRSLALDSNRLDAKVGMELVRILLTSAQQKGLQEIYLLTRSAPFFHLFGFKEAIYEEIPCSVKDSPHFRQADLELSTVMVYKNQK